MAIAAAVTSVTGNQTVVTTVLNADSTRTDVHIRNLSGAEVDVYIHGQAIAFERIEAFGENARLDVSGNLAQLAFTAMCREAPLKLVVTAGTA